MSQPKSWLYRAELVMLVAAALVFAAYAISRFAAG